MNRDLAIDATRGVAIWSMISAHFAHGTLLETPTHAFPYVDGMSAFVLLSGIVLGLVYRRWIDRESLAAAYRRLARRLVTLYVCQLTIALVAVAAAIAGHRWLTRLLPIDGWADGIWLAVTMRYIPSGGNILLLYMLLLAATFAIFPLLMRGWWKAVLAGSVALYALTLMWSPGWFYLSAYMADPHTENWAAWQIMFVPAVVVGWKWREWAVPERVDRLLVPIVAVAIGVGLAFHYAIDIGPWAVIEPDLADKVDFRPARAVGAWVLIPALYGVFRLLLRRWHHDWLRPLVMTGTRSLDSYVIQAIALVVVPIHIAHRPWDATATAAVTLLVFGMCWAWAEVRRAARIDKLHRLPVILLASGPTPAHARRPAPDASTGTGDIAVVTPPPDPDTSAHNIPVEAALDTKEATV